ncbi:MAG: tetratricopeptide repeat protein [Thermoguttaceae bacterium]|jgi:tetratricopeptide (TPR) repeat protein
MSLLGLLCFALPVAIFLLWLSQKATGASQRASVSAAYARRGTGLYMAGKDYDSAIATFTESLLVNPKNVAALMGRGGAYLERKDYADAIADLTAAIRLNPDSTAACWAYSTRGTAYLRWGDYDKAIVDLTAAINLKPDFADAYFARSSAYAKRFGLPADPRQWPKGAPGYDMIVADLMAAERLTPTDPEVREFAKAILAAIRESQTT